MKEITWYNKKNIEDILILQENETAPSKYTSVTPSNNFEFQIYDDNQNKWVEDTFMVNLIKKQRDKDAIMREISARDYRVLKSIKIASVENKPAETVLEEIYPREGEWYMQKMAEYNQLESDIEELKANK